METTWRGQLTITLSDSCRRQMPRKKRRRITKCLYIFPHSSAEDPVHFPVLCLYLIGPNGIPRKLYDYYYASKAAVSINFKM